MQYWLRQTVGFSDPPGRRVAYGENGEIASDSSGPQTPGWGPDATTSVSESYIERQDLLTIHAI